MSQYDFGTINPVTTSGTALATLLGDWRDALHSCHKGSSRPSYAVAGTLWIDDNASPWIIKVYDGSGDIVLGLVDPTGDIFILSDEVAFADPGDATKRVRIDAGNVAGGNTRVLSMPNQNVTITAAAANLLDDADAAAMRTTLSAVASNDSRLSNSREWTASTVSQSEAETGTATTRRAWTAQRIAQAIAAQAPPTPVLTAPQATTSGNQVDFTGIPSWVNEIDVLFDGFSLSGADNALVQIGDSGGVETTGYTSTSSIASTGVSTSANTSGFVIRLGITGSILNGILRLSRMVGNTWVSSHAFSRITSGDSTIQGGGTKTLSDVLDRVRVTRSGSNTLSAGQVALRYR